MIKINIQNESKVKKDFLNMVNPKLTNVNKKENRIYKEVSILDKIDTEIIKCIENCKWNIATVLLIIKSFVESEELILANPKRLNEIKKFIEYGIDTIIGKNRTIINPILSNIFDYDNWIQRKFNGKNNGSYLAERLQINTCPYCNRAYTFTLSNGNKSIVRPEFDHFFNKSTYPYLSLSLYNLIPSCHTCNHIKSDKEFNICTHFHPYIEGFDNKVLFTINPKNIDFLNKIDNFDICIKIKNNHDKKLYEKAERNLKDLELDKLYEHHKDYVKELIWRKQVYSEGYIHELFKEYEGSIFSNEEEIRRMVLGNYTELEDLIKRPLSKLTRDIAEELGLI